MGGLERGPWHHVPSSIVRSPVPRRGAGGSEEPVEPVTRFGKASCFALSTCALALAWGAAGQVPTPSANQPGLPSEMPASFEPVTDSFDHARREVMIPMRDGVKLHTVILVPKGAHHAPILLTRTPYDASALTSHNDNPTIVVLQDQGINRTIVELKRV